MIQHYKAAGYTVHALVDGAKCFAPGVFADLPEAARLARLAAAGLDDIPTEYNAFLLHGPDGLTLVDTGCGAAALPGAGRLAGLLAGMGVTPDQVRRIIYTHLHGDHVGGALAEGRPIYADAEVLLTRAERDFWQGRDGAAGQMLAACADRIRLIEDGQQVLPGVTVWSLPGHTPGHIGLRLGDLAIVADIVHSEALQLPDPETCPTYDTDPALARISRRAALARVAADGLVYTGGHVIGDKFKRLVADGAGFRSRPL